MRPLDSYAGYNPGSIALVSQQNKAFLNTDNAASHRAPIMGCFEQPLHVQIFENLGDFTPGHSILPHTRLNLAHNIVGGPNIQHLVKPGGNDFQFR